MDVTVLIPLLPCNFAVFPGKKTPPEDLAVNTF